MAQTPADPRAGIVRFIERAHAVLDQTSYYGVLGVSPQATVAQIRGSYYQLASRLHPDLHIGCLAPETERRLTAVFSRVVEAYKILADGARREQYDLGLAAGKLRWDADAAARPKSKSADAEVPQGPARRFFNLGRDALRAQDARGAVLNLRMALQIAPGNAVIERELARAEALAGGKS
jgi:DnaJ-class molecular chaperone